MINKSDLISLDGGRVEFRIYRIFILGAAHRGRCCHCQLGFQVGAKILMTTSDLEGDIKLFVFRASMDSSNSVPRWCLNKSSVSDSVLYS